jgi:hypothetical protein
MPPQESSNLFPFWGLAAGTLFGVFTFDKSFEAGQGHLPETSILAEPGIDGS